MEFASFDDYWAPYLGKDSRAELATLDGEALIRLREAVRSGLPRWRARWPALLRRGRLDREGDRAALRLTGEPQRDALAEPWRTPRK